MRSLPDSPRPGRRRRPHRLLTAGVSVGISGPARAHPSVSTEATQKRYDAPQQRTRQTRREIAAGRALADFRQRGIRHDQTRHGADVQPLADRQAPGSDEFARLYTDDGGAEDFAAFAGYDFDMAADFPLRLSAVVLVIGPAQH